MSKRKFPLNKFPELLKNPPHDIDIMLYDKKKKDHHGGKTVKKPTLSQRFDTLSQRLDELTEIVKDGFKQVNTRIDNLEKDVNSLKQDVKDINTRLDYIVQANNLKDNKKI